MLVSHPGLGATNVAQLVSLAKAKPGKLNCASPGTGTPNHLGCEMLKTMAGVNFVHVPYKGTSYTISDVVAGQVEFMFNSMPGGTRSPRQANSGRLVLAARSGWRRLRKCRRSPRQFPVLNARTGMRCLRRAARRQQSSAN